MLIVEWGAAKQQACLASIPNTKGWEDELFLVEWPYGCDSRESLRHNEARDGLKGTPLRTAYLLSKGFASASCERALDTRLKRMSIERFFPARCSRQDSLDPCSRAGGWFGGVEVIPLEGNIPLNHCSHAYSLPWL